MPARVVRAEILTSDSLSRVSMQADLLFRSMIVIADDYGRLDGRVTILRSKAFPLRPEATDAKVSKWLGELAELDDPPIRIYSVDGRPYIELTGWETHRGKSNRAGESKFPAPPEIEYSEVPEIRENPSDPPEGMESRVGVEGMESGVANGATAPRAPRSRKAGKSEEPDPRVEAAWPAIVEAFGEYGKTLGSSVGLDRSRLIAKRLDEGATCADLVAAVHGYVRGCGGSLEPQKRSDGTVYDPGLYFRPTTVFKADGFSDRVDNGRSGTVRKRVAISTLLPNIR